MTIDEFISRLPGPVRGTSRGVMARCPAHKDKTPSLSVREGDRGLLLRCFAGCAINEITQALGLEVRDLFFDSNLDPAAQSQARLLRQAEQIRRQADGHITGLEIDARREAQRFIERARNLDISEWTDAQLTRAWDDLAAAHHRLQAEGPGYYEFTVNL